MTNIIQFPKREKSPYAIHGQKIFDVFKQLENLTEDVDNKNALTMAVATLAANQNVAEFVSLDGWGQCEFAIDVEAERGDFVGHSRFRELLVPDFGIQNHTEFLRWEFVASNIKPEGVKELPNHIGQDLQAHYASFAKAPMANLTAFNYHFLLKLLEHPGMKYISHGVEDGKFVVVAVEEFDGDYLTHRLTNDFLPLLLDAEAAKFALGHDE